MLLIIQDQTSIPSSAVLPPDSSMDGARPSESRVHASVVEFLRAGVLTPINLGPSVLQNSTRHPSLPQGSA